MSPRQITGDPSAGRHAGKKRARSQEKNTPPADTAARLLTAATRLFSNRGYNGTSTKDICREAGVNIAAIHYHFGSKERLYSTIIEQFAAERLEFARKTLQPPENVADFKVRLEIFLKQTLETMIRQRDIIGLIQRDAERPESKSTKVYLDILLKHAAKLREFFDRARKKGIIAPDVESFSAAGFLMSNIIHQTRNDAIVKKFSGYSLSNERYRDRWIAQILRIFMDGIRAREGNDDQARKETGDGR